MPKPIARQLLEAWENSDLTLDQLLARARKHIRDDEPAKRGSGKRPLECDITSLSRKLHGKQILTTTEAEALAKTLDVTIAWVPDGEAKAS